MEGYDISRVAFDPKKHYAGVRMQQGRVLTDDDWNENERIENEERRRSRVDIIGPFGSPDNGFKVTGNAIGTGAALNFDIHPGTLHLGGLRLELEALERFRGQKDWRQQPTDLGFPAPVAGQVDLVFVEAWQQAVSAVEDSELFEVALGGPDTTTRLRNMRRVKLFPNVGHLDCPKAWLFFKNNLGTIGLNGSINPSHELLTDARLAVSYNPTGPADDLCSPSVIGGYLGAENQAIRVQLVDAAHLTWGFDNASPLYRVTVGADGLTVKMLTAPKDQHHFPLSNQVVEILPRSADLSNGEGVAELQGHLSKVSVSYKPDLQEFKLTTVIPSDFSNAGEPYFYMRVWHRGTDLTSPPAIAFTAGTKLLLGNTGVEVNIIGTQFNAGDHWVIAARPETPDQVVPWAFEDAPGLPPNGVRRFLAPLGILQWQMVGGVLVGKIIHDCRKKFRPLTDRDCCCTFTVGDGLSSHGDFNSIEEALENLPEEGGKLCLLPGEHFANAIIAERRQIQISGCGERSVVRPRERTPNLPVFTVISSQKIVLENMMVIALDGIAILVTDVNPQLPETKEVTIQRNTIYALVNGIRVVLLPRRRRDNDIKMLYNNVSVLDKSEGGPAIFSLADHVFIAWNEIGVIPARDPESPPEDDPENPNGDPFDPCDKPRKRYQAEINWNKLSSVYKYRLKNLLLKRRKLEFKAWGGIQVAGTSERVRILENEIFGGRGHGITLGHFPLVQNELDNGPTDNVLALTAFNGNLASNPVLDKLHSLRYQHLIPAIEGDTESDRLLKLLVDAFKNPELNGDLNGIIIERNNIQLAGLAGIGVVAFFEESYECAVRVVDLTIYRNYIAHCTHQLPPVPERLLDDAAFGGIALADCENLIIQENRIEENGKPILDARNPSMKAACGVFVLMGEFVDISDNRILDNGEPFPANGRVVEKGQRGGVVVKMSFKPFKELSLSKDQTVSDTTYTKAKYSKQEQVFQFKNPWMSKHECLPAARLHGNIVCQPAGQAVWLMAMGPVSVVGNHFTSQGTLVNLDDLISRGRNNQLMAEDLLPLFGAAVFILDLGISKDIFGTIFNNFRKIIANQNTGSAFLRNESLREFFLSLQWLPAGNILYTNNVTMLDLRSRQLSLAFCSQLIASLDDIAFNDNQSECASFALLREQATTPNEGAASSFLAADILVSNTVLAAVTVRANSNRFQEGTTMGIRSLFNNQKTTTPPLFSLISVGMLNTVVGNQSSYCLLLLGNKRIEEHNLIFHDEYECPCLKLNGWKKDQKERQEAEEKKCWSE